MSNQRNTENPTGAGKKQALQVAFDSRLKLEFHGSKVMSVAGLLAYRELDAALGLGRVKSAAQPGCVSRDLPVILLKNLLISPMKAGKVDLNNNVSPKPQVGPSVSD
jgi:hypothetical protein